MHPSVESFNQKTFVDWRDFDMRFAPTIEMMTATLSSSRPWIPLAVAPVTTLEADTEDGLKKKFDEFVQTNSSNIYCNLHLQPFGKWAAVPSIKHNVKNTLFETTSLMQNMIDDQEKQNEYLKDLIKDQTAHTKIRNMRNTDSMGFEHGSIDQPENIFSESDMIMITKGTSRQASLVGDLALFRKQLLDLRKEVENKNGKMNEQQKKKLNRLRQNMQKIIDSLEPPEGFFKLCVTEIHPMIGFNDYRLTKSNIFNELGKEPT